MHPGQLGRPAAGRAVASAFQGTRVLRKRLAGCCCNPCPHHPRAPSVPLAISAHQAHPVAVHSTETATGAIPGSVRRVRVSRHAAALEVLRRVTHQATIPVPTALTEPSATEGLMLRFPALEFRSLLLNVIGRDTFPDRAVWKRNKVALCGLLLHLAAADLPAYAAALDAVVTRCLDAQEREPVVVQGKGRSRMRTRSNRRAKTLEAPTATAVRAPIEAPTNMAQRSGSAGGCHPAAGLLSEWSSSPSVASLSSTDEDPQVLLWLQSQSQPALVCEEVARPLRGGSSGQPLPQEEQQRLQLQPPEDGRCPASDAASGPCSSSLQSRRAALRARIDGWCRATVGHGGDGSSSCSGGGESGCSGCSSAFAILRPILEQVMQMGEPAPLVDIRRNGSHTELQVAALMEGQLPAGWRLICGATILAVDGESFVNRKRLKGEADLLLVDPDGVVQAVVEVKTAKGNPYVALYEDVGKLLGLLRVVRNRTVTVRHGPSPGSGSSSSSNPGSGSSCAPGSAYGTQVTTLEFSKRLRPIYVLGCSGAALGLGPGQGEWGAAPGQVHGARGGGGGGGHRGGDASWSAELAGDSETTPEARRSAGAAAAGAPSSSPSAVVRSAWSKLLTMELGRELSCAASAWANVRVAELSREAVLLQLPSAAYEPLARRVATYFAKLAHCEVYLVDAASSCSGGGGGGGRVGDSRPSGGAGRTSAAAHAPAGDDAAVAAAAAVGASVTVAA